MDKPKGPTPIEPLECVHTGRMLTEWFENPEYTDADLKLLAYEANGLTQAEGDDLYHMRVPGQEALSKRLQAFVGHKKRTRWKGNMSQQETAMRLNEATKMVDPANFKFLDEKVQDRTGLELNPLWMMECIVRAGILSPKDQITALKELASYTHSKAPTLNQTNVTTQNPEDWLLELSKAEYSVIGSPEAPAPIERFQFETGGGAQIETRMAKQRRQVEALSDRNAGVMSQMEADFDAGMFDDMDSIDDAIPATDSNEEDPA